MRTAVYTLLAMIVGLGFGLGLWWIGIALGMAPVVP